MNALTVDKLTVYRGELPIVREASLVVEAGTITVLLGSNGAGKTTLMEGIAGAIPSKSGVLSLDKINLAGTGPYQRARQGLSLVEQGRAVFRELTVEENLDVARVDGAKIEESFELFPELLQRRHVRSGLLSGGEQQMLLIARALLARPKVLLIDEMSLGLAPLIVQRLMRMVRNLAQNGQSILLVEQFASLALAVGHRAYVLRNGRIAYDGTCQELRQDSQKLHQLYFGD
jgi:branched-chain amino acid transport system ATP-binding protein